MTHPAPGARLEVRYPEPAVDLATLVECLADAVPVPPEGAAVQPRQRWPLLSWDRPRCVLGINTRAVLQRLGTTHSFRSPSFLASFRYSHSAAATPFFRRCSGK